VKVGATGKQDGTGDETVTSSSHAAGGRAGQVVLRPQHPINGIKVFAATMFEQRRCLGEVVTDWLAAHRDLLIVDVTVTQSSDA